MGAELTKKIIYPVSECNPEEGTQWSRPEQCPEEHHHHNSQLKEKHLAATGN